MLSMQRKVGLAERIKQLRNKAKESQKDIGDLVSLTSQAIGKWERGEAEPSAETLRVLAKHWGVTTDYLLGYTDNDKASGEKRNVVTAPRHVPILGIAPCGEPMLAEQNIEGYIELPGEIAPGAELAAIRVQGDSMEGARLYDGDLALIRLQEHVEDGEIAVVCVGENREEATIKRVRYTDSYITLVPIPTENRIEEFRPIPLPTSQVRIVGKVAGVWWG